MSQKYSPLLILLFAVCMLAACVQPPVVFTPTEGIELPRIDGPVPAVENSAEITTESAADTTPAETDAMETDVLEDEEADAVLALPTAEDAEAGEAAEAPDAATASDDAADNTDIAATEPVTSTIYVIQQGDSLGAVAEQFGIDVATLAAANQITDPNQIDIGQALFIPLGEDAAVVQDAPNDAEPDTASNTSDDAPTTPTTYIVQSGDALSLIAERFGVSTAALAVANGLTVESPVYIEQTLTIPTVAQVVAVDEVEQEEVEEVEEVDSAEVETTEQTSEATTYTVQAGDSLGSISVAFDMPLETIANANGLTDIDAIYIGQELVIPAR